MEHREPERGETRKETQTQPLTSPEPGRRIFGEGGYGSGGSANEGNFEERESNPHGAAGEFDDAGGYGAPDLLGEQAPAAESDEEAQPLEHPQLLDRAKKSETRGGKD